MKEVNMLPLDEPNKPADIVVIPEVAALLQEQIPVDDVSGVQLMAARANAWQGRVAFQYRNSKSFLATLKKMYLVPKTDRSITEMEREILLAARVRDVQCQTDLLGDYADALTTRILLCQSLMKSQSQEMKSGLR
jgi:hypothetical protein